MSNTDGNTHDGNTHDSNTDGELDAELRRLFSDDRLGVQPQLGAEQAIVAGARRLRRRRTVLASAGGVTMAAVLLAGGLAIADLKSPGETVAEPPLTTGVTQLSAQAGGGSRPWASTPAPPTSGAAASSSSARSAPIEKTAPSMPPQDVPLTPPRRVLVADGPEIDPGGYGKLRLGMSVDDAAKVGVAFGVAQGDSFCKTYDFSGAGVPSGGSAVISPNVGVTVISPAVPAVTPEGVGPGTPKEKVFATYSGASQDDSASVSAPAGSAGSYVFGLDGSGQQVRDTALMSAKQDCAG